MAIAEEHLLDDIANDLFEEKCRKIRLRIGIGFAILEILYLALVFWYLHDFFRLWRYSLFTGFSFLILPAASMILQYLYGSFKKN